MLEMVELLQELGADINAASKTGMTSVNYACDNKRSEMVKFLVTRGADINKSDMNGETCLMNSVENSEISQFLINNGAHVNARDNSGNSVLHHAITRGKLEDVQLLLDHGSDQNMNKQPR